MASIAEIKSLIDLHDLAKRLGLQRPHNSGNYRSPHHSDSGPSLSIFERGGQQRWRDHSTDQGGDHVDLVEYVIGLSKADALDWLHDTYQLTRDTLPASQRDELSRAERVAASTFQDTNEAVRYLVDQRAISKDVAERAVKSRSVGWSTWTNPNRDPGTAGYGGPGIAFIVRRPDGKIVGVDTRHVDPQLNGGAKLRRLYGDDSADPWCSNWASVSKASTIYVVESAINALSVETAGLKRTAAMAVRNIAKVKEIDWRFVRGKRVIIAFDNDEPQEGTGRRAGPEAGWVLQEHLVALDIPCFLLDQGEWEHNDLNDILKAEGDQELRHKLQQLDSWLIPGVRGDDLNKGRPRVWLPARDFAAYWRYRAHEDFTTIITDRDDGADGEQQIKTADLCGFRVAGISRVTIQSAQATMSGEDDHSPTEVYAVSTQDSFAKTGLRRTVCQYKHLNAVEFWQRCGTVYRRSEFFRMVGIWGRASEIGARRAANLVGLAWLDGKPRVNEGPDTYFQDPEKQCPYHALVFPKGTRDDARKVIRAYHETFKSKAALQLLVWAVGAQLKAFLGFWPHLEMQADKGSGKSIISGRLARSIGMKIFSSEALSTNFRLLCSLNHTFHPVGWEEISTKKQDVIDKAVTLLQQSYQYAITPYGSEMIQMLSCAPVLLSGEDVPVPGLIGKMVRIQLRHEDKGGEMPDDLPVFPMRQWLEYLATLDRSEVLARYRQFEKTLNDTSMGAKGDAGARRMVANYAAVLLAWRVLCDFAGLQDQDFELLAAILKEMNGHIAETSADREPWVWVMELMLGEITAGRYPYPHTVEEVNGVECLCIRTSHIMMHLRTSPGLRDIHAASPIKSDRALKRQLKRVGIVEQDRIDCTINQARHHHLVALNIEKLESYGLYVQR